MRKIVQTLYNDDKLLVISRFDSAYSDIIVPYPDIKMTFNDAKHANPSISMHIIMQTS